MNLASRHRTVLRLSSCAMFFMVPGVSGEAATRLVDSPGPASTVGGLTISDVQLDRSEEDDVSRMTVRARVQWRNAWCNDLNHDAVWLVVKYCYQDEDQWRHARIAPAGHRVVRSDHDNVRGKLLLPADRTGFFLRPVDACRGDVGWNLQVELDRKSMEKVQPEEEIDVRLFGIEMVAITEGPFFAGDGSREAPETGGVYVVDGEGGEGGAFYVESEDAIDVGTEPGDLSYRAGWQWDAGDHGGPIPSGYPKGVRPFYVMKHELRQGEYADFLNALSSAATSYRAIHGTRGYAENGGTIRLEEGVYQAEVRERPANYLSWADGCAFADWMALRPMSELEYEKMCRGDRTPIPNEFPWGTATRPVDSGVPSESDLLKDGQRGAFGASHFWVHDLAGGLWEPAVTFGHAAGRAFEGTHGDGRLGDDAGATNHDWPCAEEGGGQGYRGGGALDEQPEDGREFLLRSPVSYRSRGALAGVPRSRGSGFRGVRTAPGHDSKALRSLPVDSGDGWEISTPVAEGVHPEGITRLIHAIESGEIIGIEGFVLARNGKLVAEAYFKGFDRETRHETRSAGKSLTSLILGVAVDRGDIDVEDALLSYVPEEYADRISMDERLDSVTIADLLTMRAGFDCDEYYIGPGGTFRARDMWRSPDWLEFMAQPPHDSRSRGGVLLLLRRLVSPGVRREGSHGPTGSGVRPRVPPRSSGVRELPLVLHHAGARRHAGKLLGAAPRPGQARPARAGPGSMEGEEASFRGLDRAEHEKARLLLHR